MEKGSNSVIILLYMSNSKDKKAPHAFSAHGAYSYFNLFYQPAASAAAPIAPP